MTGDGTGTPTLRALRRSEMRRRTGSAGGRVVYAVGAACSVLGLIGLEWAPSLTPLLLVGVVLVLAFTIFQWIEAGRHAEDRLMAWWGGRHGLAFRETPTVPGSTPLLRRGDKRRFENGLVGPIGGDPRAVVCHYTYVVESDSGSSSGSASIEQENPYTICAMRVGPEVARLLPCLQVERRGITGRLFDGLESRVTRDRVVELESVEFHGRYKLQVADRTDDVAVRCLFTPTFQLWLCAAHDREPAVELERGLLVVAVPGRERDPERLDWVLEAARHVADRVARVPFEIRGDPT